MKISALHFGAITAGVLVVIAFSFSQRNSCNPERIDEKLFYEYYHLAGASNNMIFCKRGISYRIPDREPDLIHSEDAVAESDFN